MGKKKNDFQMQETKEMDLQSNQSTEQGNDSESPEVNEPSDIDKLMEKFPGKPKDELEALLKEMPLNDAVYTLEDAKNFEDSYEDELPLENINPEPEVKTMEPSEEQVTSNEVSIEDEFNILMGEQDKMQKEFEKEKGGVITVDDTSERIERSNDIAKSGRRKGRKFKPTVGVAGFMSKQNAIYKASGKPAPYSKECLLNTLKREKGMVKPGEKA